MAEEKIKKKPLKYSQKKNGEKPMKVIEETPGGKIIEKDELLPETTTMVPVKEFAKPLITAKEATQSFQQYQELINALIKQSDIVEIQGKQVIKKTGINKIARFFGVSTEIIRHHKEDKVGPKGGRAFIWYVWVKAWLPSGQSRVDGAACSSNERRFAHLEHDVLSMAITRATKRAIENLVGMGEYEAAEDIEKQPPATSRKATAKATAKAPEKEPSKEEKPSWAVDDKENPEEKIKYEEYEVGGKKYMRAIKNGKVFREGIDPDEYKPMFKSRPVKYGGKGYPSNPTMDASDKQMSFIADKIKKTGIPPEDIMFILNNRVDGKPREIVLIDFDKGDACDVLEAIKRKKFKIVKKQDGKIEAVIG